MKKIFRRSSMKSAIALLAVLFLSQIDAQHPISLPIQASLLSDDIRGIRNRKIGSRISRSRPLKPFFENPEESIFDDLRGSTRPTHRMNVLRTHYNDKDFPHVLEYDGLNDELHVHMFHEHLNRLRSSAVIPYNSKLLNQYGPEKSNYRPYEFMYAGGLPNNRMPLSDEFIKFLEFLAECRPSWPCMVDISEHFLLAAQYGRREIVEMFLKRSKKVVLNHVSDARELALGTKTELENLRVLAMEKKVPESNLKAIQLALVQVDETVRLLTSAQSRIRPKMIPTQ